MWKYMWYKLYNLNNKPDRHYRYGNKIYENYHWDSNPEFLHISDYKTDTFPTALMTTPI